MAPSNPDLPLVHVEDELGDFMWGPSAWTFSCIGESPFGGDLKTNFTCPAPKGSSHDVLKSNILYFQEHWSEIWNSLGTKLSKKFEKLSPPPTGIRNMYIKFPKNSISENNWSLEIHFLPRHAFSIKYNNTEIIGTSAIV
jgi:hypothetical protein